MKKFLFALSLGMVAMSCGKKAASWDAAADKKYMDFCTTSLIKDDPALCSCMHNAYKSSNISVADAMDLVKLAQLSTPEIEKKTEACNEEANKRLRAAEEAKKPTEDAATAAYNDGFKAGYNDAIDKNYQPKGKGATPEEEAYNTAYNEGYNISYKDTENNPDAIKDPESK